MKRHRAGGLCLAGLMALAMPAKSVEREPFDPARSTAGITVDLRVAGEVDGRFGRIEGELEPAEGGLWRVQVRVDARELVLDGPGWMQRSTRSPRFLDVERHPRIIFVSLPFKRALLHDGGALAGDLDLRGRQKRVAFRLEPAACDQPGRDCPIRVRGSVSRREFGMTAQRLWLRDEVGFDFGVRLQPAVAP
jgi:polyisoprenoid-binding protein YceI